MERRPVLGIGASVLMGNSAGRADLLIDAHGFRTSADGEYLGPDYRRYEVAQNATGVGLSR